MGTPCLSFPIERHGQTVNGSTRATVYHWLVDLQALTASPVGEKRRQLCATDKRLDVKPIAKSLAEAIVSGRPDDRLKVMKDGSIKINPSSTNLAKCQSALCYPRTTDGPPEVSPERPFVLTTVNLL